MLKTTLKFIINTLTASFLVTFCGTSQALPSAAQVNPAIAALKANAGNSINISYSNKTGLVNYLAADPSHPIQLFSAPNTSADSRALDFISHYGKAFGISSTAQIKTIKSSLKDEVGMEHVRLQQLHKGIPITAGEMMLHLKGNGVTSVMAKTLPDLDTVDMIAKITPNEAKKSARDLLTKLDIKNAVLSKPRLEVFNKGLFHTSNEATHLAWFIEAKKTDVRQYIWIDAQRGSILLNFSQLPDARIRKIYDTSNSNFLPGKLIQSEGQPLTGDPDADAAYLYSGHTYNYFKVRHGRDSYNGLGAPMISTVHYCPEIFDCPYQNAFWNGEQMIYGDGFSAADDVVAHELTHAVTENSAGLFYYAESGALNESFSDIFGETIDQTNGSGNDNASVRWLMGEDVPAFGAIRNMKNPNAFGDPAKVLDAKFKCDTADGDLGGVHSNSGVPNHAYQLMVSGGSYNGQTITGIGILKAEKIQYRTLTKYLTSGSNFLDNYYALQKSCLDLISTSGITASDCIQVRKAIIAVQMNSPVCAKPALPALCPVGKAAKTLFFDDLEASSDNFVTNDSTIWSIVQDNAKKGALSMFGENTGFESDAYYQMTKNVALPMNAKMGFDHAFEFEPGFDGGIVEYSIDNGKTWSDADVLLNAGAGYKYNGLLPSTNPLGIKNAFTGNSFGYTVTQLNLNSLAGKNVRFRFHVGSDSSVPYLGWFIDNIHIYQCR
jgi:bacillolysin